MIRPEYTEALVRLHLPSGPVLVAQTTPGVHDGAFPTEADGGALCIITAHNPRGRTYPASENRAFHAKLITRLNADGLTWWPAAGGDRAWEHVEESVVIAGLEPDQACAIGREFGQDAIFVWTDSQWQIRSCHDSTVAVRGWAIQPTPPDLAEIDAAYRDLDLASPYVPLLHVHAAVNRRLTDAEPEDAAQLELVAAKLAKEYHRIKAAAEQRVIDARAQEALRAEEAKAQKAARRDASRKSLDTRHQKDMQAGWPEAWRPRMVDRWVRLSGTIERAREYDELGWAPSHVVTAAAHRGSAALLTVPTGHPDMTREFGDDPEDVLSGRIPGIPAGTILVAKRVLQNGKQERWHLTDSGHGVEVTRHVLVPGKRWRASHHGDHSTLEEAFTALRRLSRVTADAATEIVAPDIDRTRIAALLAVPSGRLADPDSWPEDVTSDWLDQDAWLANELGWPIEAMVRLRINGVRPIPWRHSQPSKWLDLDLEEQEWFSGGGSRHHELAEYTWFSESGGAPISWDGGNVIDLIAPDVVAIAQWGDLGPELKLVPWPASVRGRATLLANWIRALEIDTVAALVLEADHDGASLEEWNDSGLSLWFDVDDEVINATIRRLARHSDLYRTTARAMRQPTTPLGRSLRAALTEAAQTGVTNWIYGAWIDTHIDDAEPVTD